MNIRKVVLAITIGDISKMKKKFLSFALLIGMLLMVCFVPSSDAAVTDMIVIGEDLLADPTALGATVTYNSTTNTLTLNGATLDTMSPGAGFKGIIYNTGDVPLNLVLEGTNTINAGSGSNTTVIYCGDLNISGTGTLNITCSSTEYGILAGGILTMTGGTVSISGSGLDLCAYGADITGGSFTCDYFDSNDDIVISGDAHVTVDDMGLTAGDIVDIKGSSVVSADFINVASSNAVFSVSGNATLNIGAIETMNGNINISGGTINFGNNGYMDANATTADNGCVTISGGTITFAGGTPMVGSFITATGAPGIDGLFTMTGGSITITSGTADQVAFNGSSNGGGHATVISYAGSNTPVNLVLDGNALKIVANGSASLSFGAPSYTVTFSANGGTGTMDPVSKSGEYTLPANGFTAPAGKAFKCWSVVIGSAAAVEKNVGQTIDVTANTTISAVWQDAPAGTFTVTFDANGGTGTMNPVTGVSGEYTLPECSFTAPDGKTFKCWSVGDTEKDAGDKITVTADTTVKAVWKDSSSGSSFPVGIVVGAVVGVIAVVGIGFFVLKKIGKI